ncbi:class II glutamine amidotransferase [Legionella antarctica]|uniref:Class II glutamine amidotransferase n=1 Tax=Legionella antarctica TaxID=2708020 RepID=A0A6F8T3U5_9GAMM|nr:class II glutamine amidotransferase [Legionella antarctica]
MCRVLSYLGKPIKIDELLYNPDNSLITQSYNPKLMPHMMLNLAGFGMAAWDDSFYSSELPFLYRSNYLPFYDENLKSISMKVKSRCLIAHIRGVEYSDKSVVSKENVHPFLFDNTTIAFAHNGSLAGFEDIRYEIASYSKPEFKKQIRGTTDSEWMYALFLSLLPEKKVLGVNDIFDGILSLIDRLVFIRKKHSITLSSPLNFFISNGSFIVATRFVLNYGHYSAKQLLSPHMIYHSLWYTHGESYGFDDEGYKMKMGKNKNSIIISSEPLTEDSTTWIEIPEYSFIGATLEKDKVQIKSLDIV